MKIKWPIIRFPKDKIMKIKKAWKHVPAIMGEFRVPRYVWLFAQTWHQAKTTKTLDQFWSEVRTTLDDFNQQYPDGRRDIRPTPIPVSPLVDAQPIPPPLTAISGTQRPQLPKRPSPTPVGGLKLPVPSAIPPMSSALPATQRPKLPVPSAMPPVLPATQRLPLPKRPSPKLPVPLATGPPGPKSPVPSGMRSPTPVAGPSRPKLPSPSSGHAHNVPSRPAPSATQRSASSDGTSSYAPSYVTRRIPWGVGMKKRNPSDMSSLSYLSDEDLPAIKVKRHEEEKLDKGKGKMKEDDIGPERKRKAPMATGDLRDPVCKRCVEKSRDCYVQEGGRACVACAKDKLRCEDFGHSDISGKGKQKAENPPKLKKLPKPSQPRPTQAKPSQAKPTKPRTRKPSAPKVPKNKPNEVSPELAESSGPHQPQIGRAEKRRVYYEISDGGNFFFFFSITSDIKK